MGEKDTRGLGGDHLADVGVHGRVIIKNVSLRNRMGEGGKWTGLTWHRIGW